MAKARKSFPLRMDPEIFKAIQGMAEQEMRSVNAQIEFLLREAVKVRVRSTNQGSAETETQGSPTDSNE